MKKMNLFFAVTLVFSAIVITAMMCDNKPFYQAKVVNGERYLVVVIPSYNNERWCKENLESVFVQKYSNYHVIYIDDCSSDATLARVKDIIQKAGKQDKVTIVANTERKGALYNLYTAIHSCDDHAIVLTLDGDDWFKSADVLQTINRAYSDPHVWLTYGQFEVFPGNALGQCRPMPEYFITSKSYRQQPWITSHLRTFYAGLFKKIHKEDLLDDEDGKFYQVTWDQAFMFPMLEMANGNIRFIDKIVYVYNQVNPLNDFKQHLRKQLLCERIIRRKPAYQPLDFQSGMKNFVQI